MTQRAVRAGKMGIRAAAGHESGLRTSRRTARNLRSLRGDTTIDVGDSARHRAVQLQKYGFLPMVPGYPAELIESLQASMALADDPATSIGMGGLIKDSVRYVVDPLALIPRVKELLTPELADHTITRDPPQPAVDHLGEQFRQAGPLREGHHRHQAAVRHEVRVIERCPGPARAMRQSHLRGVLSDKMAEA